MKNSTSSKQRATKSWIPSKKFEEYVRYLPICTVDVLFFNKSRNKTLLFKRNNEPLRNQYFSAGGRLLKNENFEQAALRIIWQELKIHLNSKKLILGGFINEIHKTSIFPNTNYHTVNIFFGYIITSKTVPRLDNQHNHEKWLPLTSKTIKSPLLKAKIKQLKKKI